MLFLSLLVAASAPAPPAPEKLAEYERLMAGRDYPAASRLVDDLALARGAGNLRPDPLLSGLEGRLLLLRAPATMALAYLRHADAGSVPQQQRIAALFALAEAREALGDRKGMAQAFARLLSLDLDPGQRRRALLGAARARLAEGPAEAAATIRSLADGRDPAERWEADLVVAEASLLAGDAAGARDAADRAWNESGEAPAESLAPMRSALVRAAIAATAGERDRLVAALGAGFAGSKSLVANFEETLPVCGSGGIAPEDWVTFLAYGDNGHREWLTPVAASRVAIAAPFADAIGGQPLFADRRLGGPAGGLVLTLRCRTAPLEAYHAPPRDPDPWAAWFADRGLFFPLTDGALADINRLSEQIEQLARASPDDPRLIPLRLALSGFLRARAATAQDVEQWQVTQLDAQVKAAMRRIGGLDGFLFDLWDLAARIPREPIDRATALAQIRAAFSAYLDRAPLDMAYEATFTLFAEDSGLPAEIKRSWLERLARRFAGRRDDARRLSVLLMLGDAARDDVPATALAAFRQTGLPPDLCAVQLHSPTLAEHHIEPGDFPRDLQPLGLNGVGVAEFAVAADGRTQSSRILVSAPSGLFDAIILDKVRGFAMKPAADRSGPRACRAFVQPIVWKLPDSAEPGVPVFVDPDTRS